MVSCTGRSQRPSRGGARSRAASKLAKSPDDVAPPGPEAEPPAADDGVPGARRSPIGRDALSCALAEGRAVRSPAVRAAMAPAVAATDVGIDRAATSGRV